MENMVTSSFNEVFSNKTVLITGHTGFKGTWLTVWLTSMGAKVIGFSKDIPTKPSMFSSLEINKYITHIVGDVRDIVMLKKTMMTYNPEFVFHLAAQSLVIESYVNPIETYQTNTIGTANVLEACRNCSSVRSIIIVTSDKCYDNTEKEHAFVESDPMGGFDPYSSSKGCAELVVNAYRNSFFNPSKFGITHQVCIATVRGGNVIGGGDWAKHRLIPDCIRALTTNSTIILRNPGAIRAWVHVLDILSGYLWLAVQLYENGIKYSGAWNFGPCINNNISVKTLVTDFIRIWGNGKYIIQEQEDFEKHEMKYLSLNINKAKNELQWQPILDIHTALEITEKWYKNYYEKHIDMYQFSIQQINNYIKLAQEKEQIWAKQYAN